jgi:hypothetical protein
MSSMTDEMNFYLILINLNLNCYMRLVTTVSDNADTEDTIIFFQNYVVRKKSIMTISKYFS